MPFSQSCQLKRLVFDQSSPAQPISEIRGGSTSVAEDGQKKSLCLMQDVLICFHFGCSAMVNSLIILFKADKRGGDIPNKLTNSLIQGQAQPQLLPDWMLGNQCKTTNPSVTYYKPISDLLQIPVQKMPPVAGAHPPDPSQSVWREQRPRPWRGFSHNWLLICTESENHPSVIKSCPHLLLQFKLLSDTSFPFLLYACVCLFAS